MKNLYLSICLGLFIQTAFSQNTIVQSHECPILSHQLMIKKDSMFSQSPPMVRVEMISLVIDDGFPCAELVAPSLNVISSCYSDQAFPLSLSYRTPIDSSEFKCFPFPRYLRNRLVRIKHHTYVPKSLLESCVRNKLYFSGGEYWFKNVDTNVVVNYGSIDFMSPGSPIHDPYQSLLLDEEPTVEEACFGYPKTINVFETLGSDSARVKLVAPRYWNLGEFNYPFTSMLKPSLPIASTSFKVNGKSISFTPIDTGLFMIPVEIQKWTVDSTLGRWYEQSVSYKNIVVYISDKCSPQNLNSESFSSQSRNFACTGVYKIPFKKSVLKSSISPDGSDLKFHHPQNYPVVVSKAYGTTHDPVYTDTLIFEAQIFFDGQYRVQAVPGNDGDRFIGICGAELASKQFFNMNVSSCANQIGLEEQMGSKLKMYPVPAQNELHIESPEAVEFFACYAADGQLVQEGTPGQSAFTIPTYALAKGVYMLHLRVEGVEVPLIKRFTVQ